MAATLKRYSEKRDFSRTKEPAPGKAKKRKAAPSFVIQKHDARRLHYDFRLEHDGVLKSWAVTRGPSLDPGDKRLAVETEDHPVEYGTFEGTIPAGEYGGGTVMLWDCGTWAMADGKDADEGFAAGALTFDLEGERLTGRWHLQRMKAEKGRPPQWLLIKTRDDAASAGGKPVTTRYTTSVATGRDLDAIAQGEEAPAIPSFVPPMLCRTRAAPPSGDWLAEVKYDGYRALVRATGEGVTILTRSGQDWTAKFPAIARAAEPLRAGNVLLDGEIVVFDDTGRTDFSALQADIKAGGKRAVYVAFDALFDGGADLRKRPLTERKAALAARLGAAGSAIRYGDHIEGQQDALYAQAVTLGLEGIIAKRAGSRYVSGRSDAWVKVRAVRSGAFVIGGYTADGDRLGSLVVGAYDGDKLVPMGRVGTGFTAASGKALLAKLRKIEADNPFSGDLLRRGVRFVAPQLTADVAYLTVTADGQLRQAAYKGLSKDKPATVRHPAEDAMPRESKAKPPARPKRSDDGLFAGVSFTHPDKVLFTEQKVTKAALAEHYLAHMERMLPHIEGRPLTLVRCPQGAAKKCFYQRHPEGLPDNMAADIGEDDGLAITVRDAADVMELVQRGVLEIHLRGARIDRPERPDRLVFDLDPADDVGFDELRQAALDLRDKLAGVDLASFVKTTGGKGLHVLVPIERRTDWPDAKAWTRAFSGEMADAEPARFLITMSKARRKGRIFLDYLRNDRKASAVAPYSTRARPGAPFAVPITWKTLEDADALPVFKVGDIVDGPDPWADVAATRQRLTASHLRITP